MHTGDKEELYSTNYPILFIDVIVKLFKQADGYEDTISTCGHC